VTCDRSMVFSYPRHQITEILLKVALQHDLSPNVAFHEFWLSAYLMKVSSGMLKAKIVESKEYIGPK